MDLSTFVVSPVTLVLLILGIVEFIKKFGVSGNKLMVISAGVGVFMAIVYKVRELLPVSTQYIDVVFFGLAAGLCASGIYSFVNNRFPSVQKSAKLKYTMIKKTGPYSLDDVQEVK